VFLGIFLKKHQGLFLAFFSLICKFLKLFHIVKGILTDVSLISACTIFAAGELFITAVNYA